MKRNQGNQKTRSVGRGPRVGMRRCPKCNVMTLKEYLKYHCNDSSR